MSKVYDSIMRGLREVQLDVTGQEKLPREALAEAGEKSRTSDGCDVERDMQQLQGGLGRCCNR